MGVYQAPPRQTPPDRIDSVHLLGCHVMAGRYDNAVEIRTWPTSPVTPTTAATDVDDRLLAQEDRR